MENNFAKRILKAVLPAVMLALLFSSAGCRRYDYGLNTLETIKYYEPADKKHAYKLITLTPVAYGNTFLSESITAKALYKGETVGIKIVYRRLSDKIIFRSIGAESDRFMQAMAELYDENPGDSRMRKNIPTKPGNDGTARINWKKEKAGYKLGVSGLDGREAGIYLDIDIPGGSVTFGDRHMGLAKKRFVDVFRN